MTPEQREWYQKALSQSLPGVRVVGKQRQEGRLLIEVKDF